MEYFMRFLRLKVTLVLVRCSPIQSVTLFLSASLCIFYIILPELGVSVGHVLALPLIALPAVFLLVRSRVMPSIATADSASEFYGDPTFDFYRNQGIGLSDFKRQVSGADQCIALFRQEGAPPLERVCVLGLGSGEILEDFYSQFGIKPWGCEDSISAYRKIPLRFAARIKICSMFDYLEIMRSKGQRFDLILCSSMVNMDSTQVVEFLNLCRKISAYLYFELFYRPRKAPRGCRRLYEDRDWWQARLNEAGFIECKNSWGGSSFLWKGVA